MKRWILLVFVWIHVDIVSMLIGRNVCQREETYTTTAIKMVKKPKIVRTFEWCLNVPPRCEMDKTEYIDAEEVVGEEKTRYVDECCEGYVEDVPSKRCVPLDCKKCVNGRCNTFRGTCECEDGYRGRYCTEKCSVQTWGRNCTNHCSCHNDAICDPINGKCKCISGWHGDSCDIRCPDGLYGLDCKEKCQCDGKTCDHKTGRCQETTERATEIAALELETSTVRPNMHATETYDETSISAMNSVQTTTQKIPETPKPVKTTTEKYGKEKVSKNKAKFNKKVYGVENAPQYMTKTTPASVAATESETTDVSKVVYRNNDEMIAWMVTAGINGTTTTPNGNDAEWPMDQADIPVVRSANAEKNELSFDATRQNRNDIGYLSRDFISMLCVAAGVTIAIIVAAIILYFTDRSRQHRKPTAHSVDKNQKETVIPTVLFISQSTFHRELTEPITVISSDFPSAPDTILRFKSPVSTNEDFDKVFANTLREVFDSTYDHPPSVGTFREVAVKDPEHVYDEIPCWKQPTRLDEQDLMSKISSPADTSSTIRDIKPV